MKIITIDREFGAGGHSVGRLVAKRLGIEFYDRDIIAEAAKKGGLDPAMIDKEEESVSRLTSFLRAINPVSYDEKDTVFTYESRVILSFAKQGPCVLLGRCSSFILQDAGFDVVSVFLHANEEFRLKRAREILNVADVDEVRRLMHKRDVARRAYAECYTGATWGDPHGYTLALDTSRLGYGACVDIICSVAK